MTGVREGSGGTGLLEGSRPGSGNGGTPPVVPVAFVAAAATGGSFGDAPLAGQAAGDMLIWWAGRANSLNDTVLTGSVQGVIAPIERRQFNAMSGAVYATIWDGSETFAFTHTISAGAQAMMNKVVLRDASSVSVVDRGNFGSTPGWTLSGTSSTFPDFLVGDDELGIMFFCSNDPSISAPYTWTNAFGNGINPGNSNSGNGATVWNARKRSFDSGADSVSSIGGMGTSTRYGFNLLAVP